MNTPSVRARHSRPLGLCQTLLAAALLLSALAGGQAADEGLLRRKFLLRELLDILPKSPAWEEWLARTGELPPDFAFEPAVASLPDPLRSSTGELADKEGWGRRRQELLALISLYLTGTVPTNTGPLRAVPVKSREGPSSVVEEVILEFGPEHRAKLHLELIIPKAPGPFPVFLTSEENRRWALLAVSRGYMGCLLPTSEEHDQTEPWRQIWPDHDWSTLARRAWGVSRCLDYLLTLPFVDSKQIGLVGYTANGKVALLAAAMDSRLNAVIASSSGLGGACPFRLCTEAHFAEGIERLTRLHPDWFHPRLRFFVGRENRLPVDQPQVIACIAPRACLISAGLHDPAESLWAIELNYHAAKRAYDLLNKGEELNLLYRGGGSEVGTEEVETYVDWLDTVFQRERFSFPPQTIYPTYPRWQKLSREEIDPAAFPSNSLTGLLQAPDGREITTSQQWATHRNLLRQKLLWGLGEAPPFAESRPGAEGAEPEHRSVLLSRPSPPAGVARRRLSFGNHLAGDLYLPDRPGAKSLPTVIWLHPVSPATGYVAPYLGPDQPFLRLAQQGFAVFAFDHAGYGSRLGEARNFYARYPHWSLLGKQVEDTLAALESLLQLTEVDPNRLYLLGYGIGGMTALHATALEERVAGVISVAGFTPLRLDTPDKGTGGVARWAAWTMLQPRLGAFVGFETRIPYDYHEVLAIIAPRPVLLFSPRIDPHATRADLQACVEEAAKAYTLLGHKSNLQWRELPGYNHFPASVQDIVFKELRSWAGL